MIIDNIKNAGYYYSLGKNFEAALKFLENYVGDADKREDIPVDGDKVMVKCRPYITKNTSECKFEAHKKYADIHFVVGGSEKIGYSDISKLSVISQDDEKDMIFLDGEGDLITLTKGYFMITFPQDAHMPCVKNINPEFCQKLIAKVLL